MSRTGETSPRHLSPSIIEATAGFTAGVAATLVVHPFDVLKTRLQLQTTHSHWGQSIHLLRSIINTEGSWHALYRGLAPNLVGNSTSWALYFLFYSHTKSLLRTYRSPTTSLSAADYFAASGLAGVLTAVLTNPIWVLKTRMLSSGATAPGAYKGMIHGVRSIWRDEGIRGFWRGLLPSLVGISHGAVQFAAYERLKEERQRYSGKELSNADYLVLSGAAKVFAGSATYPYQVVRVRLQSYDAGQRYKGAWDAVVQTWQREGVRGFYKGLVPNIVRVLPSTCVTFLVYENVKWYMPRMYDKTQENA